MMRFSVQLFGLRASEYLPLTVRAEELGFDTVWLADHVVTPTSFELTYPYSSSGHPGFDEETPVIDVAVTLAYLAARTTRIRLGSGVLVLPMRNPFDVARTWAALQNLSGGRSVLGLGAGWMREEFRAVGAAFDSRGARFDEMLEVLGLLWSGRPVQYHGTHFDFEPVRFTGAPEMPIPLVFGGHSAPSLRRTARRGDGWFGPHVDLRESMVMVASIQSMRRELDRGHLPFTNYVRLVGDISRSTVARYSDEGVDHLVVSPFARLGPRATVADRIRVLEEAAAAVELG